MFDSANDSVNPAAKPSSDSSTELQSSVPSSRDSFRFPTMPNAGSDSANTLPGVQLVDGKSFSNPVSNPVRSVINEFVADNNDRRPFAPDGRGPAQRFDAPRGPVGQRLREGLNNLRRMQENPGALERLIPFDGRKISEIVDIASEFLPGTDLRFDPTRKEISLSTDFSVLYDRMVAKDPQSASDELKQLSKHLQMMRMSPDTLDLRFDAEQIIEPGKDAAGSGAGFKLALGADRGWTTFDLASSETSVSLTNIRGLQAILPGAENRRISVHAVKLDTSDPDNPKGSLTIDNLLPRPENLPSDVDWPPVEIPFAVPKEPGADGSSLASSLPAAIQEFHTMRGSVKSGDLLSLTQVDFKAFQKLMENLKVKPPVQPPAPEVSPEISPDKISPDKVSPDKQTPDKQSDDTDSIKNDFSEIIEKLGEKKDSSGSLLDVSDLFDLEFERHSREDEKAPASLADNHKDPLPGLELIDKSENTESILDTLARPRQSAISKASLLANSPEIRADEKSSANSPKKLPEIKPSETPELAAIPEVPSKIQPAEGRPASRSRLADSARKPEQSSTVELLKSEGLTELPTAPPAKEFFRDLLAGAEGPLARDFLALLDDRLFLKKLEDTGKTISTFDLDPSKNSMTLGLDFSLAYEKFVPKGEQKPEMKEFLTGLASIELSAERLVLNLDGQRKLSLNEDGKEQDIWMGMDAGKTSFDIETSDNSLHLLNIKGLEAEVKLLGKRLKVHEIKLESGGDDKPPTGTVVVDNPIDKPAGVPEQYWQKTVSMPLPIKEPQTGSSEPGLVEIISRLNGFRNGAIDGDFAEKLKGLSREKLISMLRLSSQ